MAWVYALLAAAFFGGSLAFVAGAEKLKGNGS
jgi:hypothetical protein